MTETDPEKRLIGYACISTYGQILDTQLSRAHLRRRRRSGIGRLTDPTAAAQLWLRAGSSAPNRSLAGRFRKASRTLSSHGCVVIPARLMCHSKRCGSWLTFASPPRLLAAKTGRLAWSKAQGGRMRRRKFMAMFSGAVLVLPASVQAQQPAMPVIGVLHGVAAAQWSDRMIGFAQGLAESGFVDGRNMIIEYRWAEGQFDRLPAMAADLVSRKAAVICAGASDVAIRAAMEATKTIPIVFTTASDPVRAGFVSSFNRPGGNVTGATFMGVELVAKRVELLRETIPGATRIALLVNPNNPGLMRDNIDLSRAAGQRLGLEMIIVR